MSKKEKLVERFKALPKDFTWAELVQLFAISGFELGTKGRTSGSRVIFSKGEISYIAHKPHPDGVIKSYVMKQVYDFLSKNKLL